MRRLVGVLSGGMQNGYYNTGDGRIYVNTQSGDPAVQVISHELTHSIEKSRFYAKLKQVVLKKIKADGLDLDTLAPMLKCSKKVNGTYYVIEAIPESKYKKFWVVSAYMEKADGGTQASNANGPGNTPNASLASSSPASNSTIADTDVDVNGNHVQQDQKNGSIRYTVEDLERARRAAFARNETERTGILAGATTRQIEQAQRVGKLVRREVLFFSEGQDASGGMQNGYYNTGDGRIYVNTQSGDPAVQVISHELTHSIEKSRFYAKLQQVVLKKIKADGLDLNTLRAEKQALYERHGVTDVDVDAEIVAEYVSKNLLSDEQSIRSLVMESQTLGQRIMEFIDQLLAMMGNKNAQERELLSKARRYYQKALVDSWGQDTTMRQGWFNGGYDPELDWQNGLRGGQDSYSAENAKYSIGEITDEDGNSYGVGVHLDSTLLENLTDKERLQMLKERVKELGGQHFTAYDSGGDEVDVKIAEPNASFVNKSGKKVSANKDLTTKNNKSWVKQEAVVLADELIETASFNKSKDSTHPHDWLDNDGKNPWDYWKTYIQDKDGTIWKAILNVANTASGEKVLYDISPIKKVGQSGKSDTSLLPTEPSVRESDISAINSIIRNHEENVNRKFSISEEKNLAELYRAQLRALERLNLAASKEYDGYVEQLNRYRLQQQAKKVLEEYYAAVHENEEAINELKRAYRDWVREQNLNREVEEDN